MCNFDYAKCLSKATAQANSGDKWFVFKHLKRHRNLPYGLSTIQAVYLNRSLKASHGGRGIP